jgi:DNA-binding transcriptional regulator YiaG
MQVEGTRMAFLKVVGEPGFAARHGLSKTDVSNWKAGRRVPTLDKMEEVLCMAGATIVQEKVWEVK